MVKLQRSTAVPAALAWLRVRKRQARSPHSKALRAVVMCLHRCSALNEVAGGCNSARGEVHDRTKGDTGHFPSPVDQPLRWRREWEEGGGASRIHDDFRLLRRRPHHDRDFSIAVAEQIV